MRYVVLIDGKAGEYGVVVPDLPGCTAMGETVEAALVNVSEAMRDWADVTAAEGGEIPAPRAAEKLRVLKPVREALAEGATIASVPLIRDTGRSTRANLSIDSGVLAAIDAEAARRRVTRSTLIEIMARQTLAKL